MTSASLARRSSSTSTFPVRAPPTSTSVATSRQACSRSCDSARFWDPPPVTRRVVSILSPDLGGNALGRAYVLAKLLADDFQVHIIGFTDDSASKPWAPIRNDTTIQYRPIHGRT